MISSFGDSISLTTSKLLRHYQRMLFYITLLKCKNNPLTYCVKMTVIWHLRKQHTMKRLISVGWLSLVERRTQFHSRRVTARYKAFGNYQKHFAHNKCVCRSALLEIGIILPNYKTVKQGFCNINFHMYFPY